ncbi:MAG TPA: hypothetical protein VH682_12865 [Gemmataceae bacterium]|jgi:hypothetical protein
MKPAVGRLLVTIALFAGWLGYLGYLVLCRPHTPGGLVGAFDGRSLTLSRPQFLKSTVDVVARVDDKDGENVIVEEVLYPQEKTPVKAGDKIKVTNIPLPDSTTPELETPADDWTGPGMYILPLQSDPRKSKDTFEVAPTPPSPGYRLRLTGATGPPRIYPATPEMLAEYRQIAKPE